MEGIQIGHGPRNDELDDLIFIYNADSGWFNLLVDFAHKILAPSSYNCSLCMLTYGNTGMKKEWRIFLESLPYNMMFLHKDEAQQSPLHLPEKLPAILLIGKQQETFPLVSAHELNHLHTLKELLILLEKRLSDHDQNKGNSL